ncbi:unnamed protein product [Rhizophagus irregularis]|nr:unnamed protein product [Rhizophagus irregularis]
MSNLTKTININSDSEEENQSSFLLQKLAHNKEKLEKILALINTIYNITDVHYFLFPINLEKPGDEYPGTFYPFLEVKCKDEKKTYQDVKFCSITASKFKNAIHSAVNLNIDLSSKNSSFSTISSLHQIQLNIQK